MSSRAAISARLKAKVAMPAFPSTRLRARELRVSDVMMTRRPGAGSFEAAPLLIALEALMVPGVTDSRAALVTGGTGRVGGAVAARLEAEGFRVLTAGRRDGDLSDPRAAAALVERAARELGGLDLVVHAAADGFEPRPVDEVREEHWDAAFGATAKGSFFVAQAAAPHLRASGLGCSCWSRTWPLTSPGRPSRPTAPPRRLRRCSPASSPARSRRTCACAALRPAPSRSSRVRRSGAQRRRWSAGSAPDDVAEAVAYLVARPSSPERPWWWTAAASCGSRPETGSGLSSVYPWVYVCRRGNRRERFPAAATCRGDKDAFTELYRRFARPVFAMAVRQLGDNGRAEEAAQETFAAVWRSARSYRPERGSGSAWLYAVARHAIIDRARQRREPVVEVFEEASTEAGPDAGGRRLARVARPQRARAAPRA